jgi:hypothetical protein
MARKEIGLESVWNVGLPGNNHSLIFKAPLSQIQNPAVDGLHHAVHPIYRALGHKKIRE